MWLGNRDARSHVHIVDSSVSPWSRSRVTTLWQIFYKRERFFPPQWLFFHWLSLAFSQRGKKNKSGRLHVHLTNILAVCIFMAGACLSLNNYSFCPKNVATERTNMDITHMKFAIVWGTLLCRTQKRRRGGVVAQFFMFGAFLFVRSEINAEGHLLLSCRIRSPGHQMVDMHSLLVLLKHLWRPSLTAGVSWASRVSWRYRCTRLPARADHKEMLNPEDIVEDSWTDW